MRRTQTEPCRQCMIPSDWKTNFLRDLLERDYQ